MGSSRAKSTLDPRLDCVGVKDADFRDMAVPEAGTEGVTGAKLVAAAGETGARAARTGRVRVVLRTRDLLGGRAMP